VYGPFVEGGLIFASEGIFSGEQLERKSAIFLKIDPPYCNSIEGLG